MLNIASRTMIIPAGGSRATGELRMSQPWKIEFGIDPLLRSTAPEYKMQYSGQQLSSIEH